MPPVEANPQMRRIGRKHTVKDYSKLMNYDEDEELDSKLPPSPVKHKRPTNLLWKPSRNRQKIERNRWKNKSKRAAGVTNEARDSQSSTSSHIGTSPPTVSDIISPNTQPTEPPSTTTVRERNIQNEETLEGSDKAIQPSTSKGTTIQPEQNETVLVPASKEETKIAIDALLSLGSDLNYGLDAEPTANDLLQRIAPANILPDPTLMVSEMNSDDTEILDEHVAPNDVDNQLEPSTKGTDVKQETRKGQLVVQSFQLPHNHRPRHKFSCVGCSKKFANNKELNDHFRNSHPPLTCSDCKKLFPRQVPSKNTSTHIMNLCMSVTGAIKVSISRANYHHTDRNILQTRAWPVSMQIVEKDLNAVAN